MADSERTEHVTTSKMECFCARALDETELTIIAHHLSNCSNCSQQFVVTLGRQKGTTTVSFTLAPEFWLRHHHINYEQLVEFADNKLDATERELIDLHTKVCAPCQEDVRSFLTFREQIASEMQVSYAPVVLEPVREKSPWWNSWRGLAWKPIYAAAIVLIGIALIIAALFLKRKADNLQALQTPTPNVNLGAFTQTPTPENRASNGPSPAATSSKSPVQKPNSTAAMVALNDRGGTVTVDANGNVSGLDDVPASTRDEIAQALLSEGIKRPTVLRNLGGPDATLRGNGSEESFRLIFPSRTVLVSDRPIFKWEQLPRASSYRVHVSDSAGIEVAKSDELSSELTEWTVSKPLKRGEIYTWTVVAVVEGKEIVSPGPSAREMKFQILSASSLQELSQLQRTRSHLALGIFYSRVGLMAEAEREFQQLRRLSPNSKAAGNLRRSVRLVRGNDRKPR